MTTHKLCRNKDCNHHVYFLSFFFSFPFSSLRSSVSESNYGIGLCLEAKRSSGFDFEEMPYPLANQLPWVILGQVIMGLPQWSSG